jgi:hypothetical protein
MLKSDVCRTASVIEDMSCLTNVTLILRQHRENPDDVVIHCIRSDKATQRLQELASMGYTQGPSLLYLIRNSSSSSSITSYLW